MVKLRLAVIAFFLLLSSICNGQRVITKFINRYLPVAQSLSAEYGIPVAIILGVSILESGSGTSSNAKQLNNYFGVTGRNNLRKRHSVYKQYAKAEDSFRDFCEIVSRKKFYPGLKDKKNFAKWLGAMNHAAYAGAKSIWIDRVTQIVKKYNLQQYDGI
jgi:flagellum-specific peptidoglycan hydrolase FlgJ